MIVSSVSYITVRSIEPHSIYAMRLARQGHLLSHHKDQSVIALMNLDKVIDKTRPKLAPEMTLGHMLQVVANSKRLHFAICAPDGSLLGQINLNNIRHIISVRAVSTVYRARFDVHSFGRFAHRRRHARHYGQVSDRRCGNFARSGLR